MAVAPLAKLTTPEPRNVNTTPRAMAAYRAPDPVPPNRFCNCSLALVGLRTVRTTIRATIPATTAAPIPGDAGTGIFLHRARRPRLSPVAVMSADSGPGRIDRRVAQRVGHRYPPEILVL